MTTPESWRRTFPTRAAAVCHLRERGVALTERPTDEDIRSLHEFLRGWEP